MGKRKRGHDLELTTAQEPPKSKIRSAIDRNVSKISDALQLASRFERQKLGRRQKTATSQHNRVALASIEDEIEALKLFNIQTAAERQLRKILLRVKSIASSNVAKSEEFFNIEEDDNTNLDKASANLKGRLFKSKGVHEAIDAAVESIKKKVEALNEEEKASGLETDVQKSILTRNHPLEINEETEDEADEEDYEELMSKYAGRLGASDSEGSEVSKGLEESEDEFNGFSDPDPPVPVRNLSISLSPSPSPEDSFKKSKLKATPSKSNMFLPSLTEAGYISASDSSASDINDEIAPRKNRRGQRERRAIAEKKYGNNAKHLISERTSVQSNGLKASKKGVKDRNTGWDPRRGAVSADEAKGRFVETKPRFSTSQNGHIEQRPSNDFDTKKKARDDEGPLHPSWAARKAAKTKEKMALGQYSGTKVVFD